jgi:hypothetical protein
MSSVIDKNGNVTVIRKSPPKIERATPDDFAPLKGAAKLARITNAQTDAILAAYPQLPLDYTEFEVTITGTVMSPQSLRLQHNYGDRVRWWFVEQDVALPNVHQDTTNTTADTLVLTALSNGSFVIRVQPRGV